MNTILLSEFIRPSRDDILRLEWQGILTFLGSEKFQEINKKKDADIVISLQGFDYINADGLIWVLLLGDLLKSKNNSLWLELPREGAQLQYLKSSNFCDIAKSIFSFTNLFYLDTIKEMEFPKGMEFFRVDLSSLRFVIPKISSFLISDLSKRLNISLHNEIGWEFFQPFVATIIETSKNIVQHSGKAENEGWGYSVISQIRQRKANRFRFCIGDAGRGFLSSLMSKKLKVTDDIDAIRNALLFRYHTKGGEGLFRIVMFASKLQGFINIHSGYAMASLDLRNTELYEEDQAKRFIETNLELKKNNFYFPGVQIHIDVFG